MIAAKLFLQPNAFFFAYSLNHFFRLIIKHFDRKLGSFICHQNMTDYGIEKVPIEKSD